jgi:hypothetical protein
MPFQEGALLPPVKRWEGRQGDLHRRPGHFSWTMIVCEAAGGEEPMYSGMLIDGVFCTWFRSSAAKSKEGVGLRRVQEMVVATQVVFALVLALSLGILVRFFLQRQTPRSGGFFPFVLLLFLCTLAGGLWLRPFGPVYFGVFWMPIIAAGVFAALFLYYTAPRRPPRNREETIDMMQRLEKRKKLEEMTYITTGLLFWVLVIMLGAAIGVYLLRFI